MVTTIVLSPKRALQASLAAAAPRPVPVSSNVVPFPGRTRSSPAHGGLRLHKNRVQPPVRHLDRAQPGEVEVHSAEDVDALARGQSWED